MFARQSKTALDQSAGTASAGQKSRAAQPTHPATLPVWARHSAPPLVLQASLKINEPGDIYEQEADRVAGEVMRKADSSLILQRKVNEEVEEEDELLQTRPQIQRQVIDGEGRNEAPPIVSEVLRSLGRPLDPAGLAFMEPRFNHDFSRVRIHSDAGADTAARAVHAKAFTLGNHIVFAQGQYAPSYVEGQRLLAHELVHVLQQSRTVPLGERGLGLVDDAHDRKRESATGGVARGRHPGLSALAPSLPRIHRDLATPRPAVAPPPQQALTETQIQEAIQFNSSSLSKADALWIQDIVGARRTGSWDKNAILLVALLQEQYGLKRDGKINPETFAFLKRERALERQKFYQFLEESSGPKPIFDRSGGKIITINANTAQEFARNITATIGSPHVKPEFEPDIQIDFKTGAGGKTVPGTEKITSIGLKVKTAITKVRFGTGRPNSQHKKAIDDMVAAIKEHEETHRYIIDTQATFALWAAQKFVGTGRTKAAEKALTTDLECAANKKHEALDAVEGLLTAVEQPDGSVRVTKSSSGAKYPCP
jgi:hypothetical protein